MAELLVYAKNHWMESLPQETIDNFDDHIMDKYESRYKRGDVVEVYEDGRCTEAPIQSGPFVVIKIPGTSVDKVKQYLQPWKRDITATRTLNDEENGIFEYTINIVQTSISGEEKFKVRERFKLPPDVSVIEKTANSLTIRLEPRLLEEYINFLEDPSAEDPSILTRIDPIERRNNFQQNAKKIIKKLSKIIRRRKYTIDWANLPSGIKDTLINDRWITATAQQIQPYIINRSVL